MVIAEDIKDRIDRLHRYSVEEDRAYLRFLGDELRLSQGDEITGLHIKYLSELLTELYAKYYRDDSGIDENLEYFWFEVRGEAMSLSRRNEDTYDDYFKKALRLSRIIKQLAERIGVVALPLTLFDNSLQIFG